MSGRGPIWLMLSHMMKLLEIIICYPPISLALNLLRPPDLMPKKILIIEDDRDVLDTMKYILEDEVYGVIGFSKGQSLAEIIRLEPQLILLDERLPENRGHKLCASIKAHPVILISAVMYLESIAAGCKADNCIKKPFNLQDLPSQVNFYLQ
jgi:two-component system phosphate regulon response regulator PhoB